MLPLGTYPSNSSPKSKQGTKRLKPRATRSSRRLPCPLALSFSTLSNRYSVACHGRSSITAITLRSMRQRKQSMSTLRKGTKLSGITPEGRAERSGDARGYRTSFARGTIAKTPVTADQTECDSGGLEGTYPKFSAVCIAGQKRVPILLFQKSVLWAFHEASSARPQSMVLGQVLAIIPRHPGCRIGYEFSRVALQLNKIVEGIGSH